VLGVTASGIVVSCLGQHINSRCTLYDSFHLNFVSHNLSSVSTCYVAI
jgi:hypothetical protein